ncbi:Copine family protein 2, partial [Trichinella papuae]
LLGQFFMAALASFEECDYREIVDYDDLYFDEHFDCDDSGTLLFWFYWQPVITMIAVVTISVLYYWILARGRRIRIRRIDSQASRVQQAEENARIKRPLKQENDFDNFDPTSSSSSSNKRPHFEQQCIIAELHQQEIRARDFLQLSFETDCLKDRNGALQSREMTLNSCAMKSLANNDESGVLEKAIEHGESAAFSNMPIGGQLLINSECESKKHDQNCSNEVEKSTINDQDNNNVALFVVSSFNQAQHAQSDQSSNLESRSSITGIGVCNIETAASSFGLEEAIADVDSTKTTTTVSNSDEVEKKNTDNLSKQSVLLTVDNDNRTTCFNIESAESVDNAPEIDNFDNAGKVKIVATELIAEWKSVNFATSSAVNICKIEEYISQQSCNFQSSDLQTSNANDVGLVVEMENILARKHENMMREIKYKHGETVGKNSTNVGKKESIQLCSMSSEREISSTDFPQSDELLFIASKAALEQSQKTNLEVGLQQTSSPISAQSIDEEMKLYAKDKDTKFVMFHTGNSENNRQHSISTESSSTGTATAGGEPISDCMSCTDGRNLELDVIDCAEKQEGENIFAASAEKDENVQNDPSQNKVHCSRRRKRRRRTRRRKTSSSKLSFNSGKVEHVVKSDFSDNGNIDKDDNNTHKSLLHVVRDVIENSGSASKSVQSGEALFMAIDEQILKPKVITVNASSSLYETNVAEICNKNDALDNLEIAVPVHKLLRGVEISADEDEEEENLTMSNKSDTSNEVSKAVSICSTEFKTTAHITGNENSEIQLHSIFVVDAEKSQPDKSEETQAVQWDSLQAMKSTSGSSILACDSEMSDKMIKSDGKKQMKRNSSALKILQERKSERSEEESATTIYDENKFERNVDIEIQFNDDDDNNLKNSSFKMEKKYLRSEKMQTEIVRTVEIYKERHSEENALLIVAVAPSIAVGGSSSAVQVELPCQAEELSSVLGNEIAYNNNNDNWSSVSGNNNDYNCSSDPSVFARSQLLCSGAVLPLINQQESNAYGGETCDEHTTATEIDSDELSLKSKENESTTAMTKSDPSASSMTKSINYDRNNVGKYYYTGQDGIPSPPLVSSLLEVVGATSVTQAVDKLSTLEAISDVMRRAGLESSNLIFGIDYTASNKYQGEKSFDHKCLHTIHPVIQNPYQQVITIMGKTLAPFSNGGTISAFGFGDVATSDMSVFPLKMDGECHSFEEVLNVYNTITPKVILCGPTNFAPLIFQATEICKKVKSYHILVIVADGQVTSEKATRDAIVHACKYPLSIIVVGVGDGPWDMMRVFDESLPKRKWDNFHFVNFHQVTSNSSQPELAFVLEALLEIPDQYKKIKSLGLLDFDSSDRLQLFLVGKSKRTQSIIAVQKLPVVYDYLQKAWITRDIFLADMMRYLFLISELIDRENGLLKVVFPCPLNILSLVQPIYQTVINKEHKFETLLLYDCASGELDFRIYVAPMEKDENEDVDVFDMSDKPDEDMSHSEAYFCPKVGLKWMEQQKG